MKESVLVGLSGGVDSTVCAKLLSDNGYNVKGACILMSDEGDTTSRARQSAEELGIELCVIDARERFEKYVKQSFISEYLSGRTPNPCVVCNPLVKIHMLCQAAKANGCSKIATGHYVKVYYNEQSQRYSLAVAEDINKDQSYVLWRLNQQQLSMLITPLGGLTKQSVFEKARGNSYSSSTAKESQEICFIPDNDYVSYITAHTPSDMLPPPGNFIDRNGNILGRHKGIIHYTYGQRKGLGIALGKPAFVLKTDCVTNDITLGFSGDEYTESFKIKDINFVSSATFEGEGEYEVKIRYKAQPVAVKVNLTGDGGTVTSNQPLRAVTPGQSAVFYKNEELIFGGVIDTV